MRALVFALILLSACAPSEPAEPVTEPSAPEAAVPAPADTLAITADDRALADRPEAPLRIDGACPFEGCVYGPWTTSAETTVYAASGDTTSAAFTVPAGTMLEASDGFVLLTRLGEAVATEATELFVTFEESRPVAEGDTVLVLDYEGEGSYRLWHDGTLGFSGVGALDGPVQGDLPLRQTAAPEAQWWARVTAPDGRAGWLWMDRTPDVTGADALSG